MSILSVGIERGTEIGKEMGKELGTKIGRREEAADSILDFLQDLGPVPEALTEKIRAEKDMAQLRRWLKKAARTDSVETFANEIEELK